MELGEAVALVEEMNRRFGTGWEGEPPYVTGLFREQREFFDAPHKRKAALCGRRAGKTEALAAWLLDAGWRMPNEMSAYIALRRTQARNVLWRTLIRVNQRHNLELRFRETDKQLTVVLPNDHVIWLAGCDDYAEADKFRGARYARIAIDEAQSFGPYLRELVDEVLDPALLDLRGDLALCGTPSPTLAGYFYEITTGAGDEEKWPTYHWTSLENVHLPHARKDLEERRQKNGWSETTPFYLREWMGLWVKDIDSLVFPFDAMKNAARALPGAGLRYVLGVDLGWHSKTAFCVMAYQPRLPDAWIVRAWKRGRLIPSAVAAHIDQIRHEFPVDRIVVDTGGLGRAIVEDFRAQYGIPAEPAEKRDKLTAAERVRGALLSGTLHVSTQTARELLDEWALLQWREDRKGFDDRFADDLSDACLYAYRACQLQYRPEHEPPRYGSREYYEHEEKKMMEFAARGGRKPTWWRHDGL